MANDFLEGEKMISWLIENKEWIFSGIGIFIIGFIIQKTSGNKLQIGGKNTKNLMADGDININTDNKKK